MQHNHTKFEKSIQLENNVCILSSVETEYDAVALSNSVWIGLVLVLVLGLGLGLGLGLLLLVDRIG